MKTGKYGLKEFEDSDDADLVQYSKEMNEAIEKALDKNKGEKGDKGDKGDKGEKGDGIVPILVDIVYGKYLNINSAKYSKNRLEISGDMEQETTKGLQLYDDTDYFLKTSDITINNKHYITITMNNTSGTSTVYKEFHTNLSSLIKPSTEYTFVIEIKSVNGNGILRINSTNNGKIESQFPVSLNYNLNSLTAGQIIKYKATSISDFANLKRFLRSNILIPPGKSGSITFRISVLEGDKTSQPFEYEPFTGGKAKPNTEFPSMPLVATGVQKIRQFGKQWFNKSNINKLNAVVDTSSITANSSAKSFYIKAKSDTAYTISRKVIGARFVVGTTANIPKIGEAIIDRMVNNSGSSIILTTSKNANYLVVYYLYNSSENEQEILDSIQIEEGSVATEWEPYNGTEDTLNLGSTELCAIENVQDRFVIENGKWCKQQNINKHKFAGSDVDSVNFYSDNTNTLAVNLLPNKVDCPAIKYNNVISMCCDKFKFINNIEDTEHIYVTGNMPIENGYKGNIRLYINKDRLSGYNSSLTNVQKANLVKTWLQANPITVYYIASSPTYIDCTTEQSNVLDKLYNNLELQKGTNNIIVESSNGVGINMELTYLTDNEMNSTFATKKELHEHENKEILDNIEEPYTTVEMTKLKGIEEGATALKTYFVPVDIDTTTGWYKALDGTLTDYNNRNIILLITQLYSGASGILKINVRSNNGTLSNAGFYWLANTGLSNSNFALNITGNKFTLYVQTTSNYHKYEIRVLENELLSKKEATINFYAPLASDKATLQSDGNNYPSVRAYASNDSVGLKINGFNGRIADINLNKDTNEYGRKRTDIVTNSVTNKNGIGDGFLETYYWDNAGKYDIQYFLPNSDAGRPAIRINSEKGWKEWKFLPFLDDIIALKKDLLKRTHEFAFTDFGSGTVYYNLLGLYTDNLTKKEVGYTTGVNVTYKQVQDIQGQINTGITGETIYMSVRLTYTDLGTIEITQDKYGNLYNIYMETSSGGQACFTGNTKILTDEGLKELEDIKIRDRILTTKGYKQVLKKYEHITDKIYNIVINDKLVQCSYSHPFVTARGTVMAKDLLKGDIVYNINKEKLEITNITVEEKETKVFEINTDIDNYYITDKNILVSSEKLL